MGGNGELISFLRRAFGYSLTGDTSEDALFLLYGTGANGKSTLLRVLLDLFGDYGKQAAPDVLLARRRDEHPTGIADLRGARLVTAVETDEGRRLAEGLVKQLTGGDRIKARFMRQDYFEFDPTFKLFLATNHKPVIRGTDYAIWRRVMFIPFTVVIPPAERVSREVLRERFRVEQPGILAWAVRGCLEWQQRGLDAPSEVRAATEAYRAEQDILREFLEDRCTLDPGNEDCWVRKAELYKAYTSWAEGNGERPMSKYRLGSRLLERGIGERRTKTERWWTGVSLREAETQVETSRPRAEILCLPLEDVPAFRDDG